MLSLFSAGFFEFVALPLFKAWSKLFGSPSSILRVKNIVNNKAYWDAQTPKNHSSDSEEDWCLFANISDSVSPSSLRLSYNDFYVILVCVISNMQQIITVRSSVLLSCVISFSALKFSDFSYHTNLLLLCSISYTTVELLWCMYLVHFSKWLQDTTQHGHYIVGGYVCIHVDMQDSTINDAHLG